MTFFVAVVVYLFSFSIEFVMSSHFRGGTMCILPDQSTNTILLKSKLSWQQSYSEHYHCNATTIAAYKKTNVDGNFRLGGSCSGPDFSTIPLQCTEYSGVDDWMSGMYNTSLQCSSSYVEVWYTGIGWPKIQNGNWSLYLNASLEKRSDTGQINHSPITLIRPILRILTDCNHTFTIPVADNDGDIIRCRYSTNDDSDECGGACGPINGLSLHEETCSLHYSENSVAPGTYVVAIQIEDYMAADSHSPMSSMPLQFIIEFVDLPVSCQYPYVSDTLNSSAINLDVGVAFNDTLIGTSENDTQYITDIEVTAPSGLTSSDLQSSQNNGSNQIWFVEVYWIPTSDQEGINLFCFIALNNLKLTSIQKCIQITATGVTVIVNSDGSNVPENIIVGVVVGVLVAIIVGIAAIIKREFLMKTLQPCKTLWLCKKLGCKEQQDKNTGNNKDEKTENNKEEKTKSNQTLPLSTLDSHPYHSPGSPPPPYTGSVVYTPNQQEKNSASLHIQEIAEKD